MSKKCTPLWREAHFEVKMYKTPQCRTAFGSSDVEKVHAVVARSTFGSQNVQNTTVGVRTTFGGSDVEKVQAVVARRTFRSQNVQNTSRSDHFWRFRCRFASLHYITLSRVWSLFPFYNRSILQAVSHKGDRDTGRQELRPTMTNQFS